MVPRHGIMKAFPKVKRARVLQGKDAPPLKKKPDECDVTGNTFNGVTVYILPAGIGNARCQIFQKQIQQNGGQTENSLCPGVTHVVVDDNMDSDRALRLLKVDRMPSGVHLVKCTWLSLCISEKQLLDVASYSHLLPNRDSETKHENIKEELPKVKPAAETIVEPVTHQTKQGETIEMTLPDTKEEPQGEDDGVPQSDLEALITGQNPKDGIPGPSLNPGQDSAAQDVVSGKWVCAQSSQSKSNNFNKPITDKLEVLAKAYTHQGDKWRALSYSKAVNALKSYHKPITSYQEALQIPGIGKRMADKIDEIMESGHLRKLDHIGEAVPVLELFTNIWGAGAKTAQLWYQQGFRTLEDIRTKALLSSTQKIGIKHYDDFLDRMPREEAAAIEKVVRDAAQAIDPGLLAMACGSYRRGKATCGDVDVLISHPNGKSHKGIFSKVLQSLHNSGFLTDDLVSHEENGEQKKYMGVCRLPGPGHRHRRLDIIVVPYNEFACALMYFTGSAHFNRSMRALARTKNMGLSEHSLNKAVVRQGNLKVCGGTPLPTPTEKDVFSLLGIPYREPHERDW
ncbi:DNA polymerase lambda [Xiphias gladius]|uniref:DNA polymerase lambda n=1 Tax=Xiphias gladius TaxID=8245 RepID=UPI001A9831E4|nr:DNA polymerase lambda [Xiphias gladius]XP_040002816.1 DNA polymerase lambda [Xiphias gladius]XP_040002817.1 DNA polymerase lambda [Xiphias gladius]XP_040002818.1 DNA polymerase lambda [Xiphias gladius]